MRSIFHSFNTELAKEYGMAEAVLIHHFQHWITVNQRLKRNHKEGRTWSYQTILEIEAHFCYLSNKQVRRILDKLVKTEVLIKGNFNKHAYDRTVWYAFKDENKFLEGLNLSPKRANGNSQTGEPIPDTKPYTNNTSKEEVFVTNPKLRVSQHRAEPLRYSIDDKKFLGIKDEDMAKWKVIYPSIDLTKEITKSEVWLRSNPTKAKLKKLWCKYLTGWLQRAEDRECNKQAYRSNQGKPEIQQTKDIKFTSLSD